MLRFACESDLERLPEIQVASRQLFEAVGRLEVLYLPVVGEALMLRAVHEGGLVVAAPADDMVVGFGLCALVGRTSHLYQMSVMPCWAGRKIGSTILSELLAISMKRGDAAMTLITYADIPWNRPFYARHGFREIPPSQLPEHLSRLLVAERASGVDTSLRVAMSYEFGDDLART
jgi:ribosomal protein S18 acetylase RimI-like enzyme